MSEQEIDIDFLISLVQERPSVDSTPLRCDIVRRRNAGVAYNALFRYDDATQRTTGASLLLQSLKLGPRY
ncbi:unnamed protein product [Pieris brassicae]|uniref:Uncharacterized protein n=1 Tax=Pieris brassicae TaxID=7116 RepID=A0A9P0XF49_PIEBR|nr:unnamed protein product [Pieris brassicae]